VKIVTVATFEKAADVVVQIWENAGKPNLLRIEGFDGVGKSGLSKLVADRIGAAHIEVDKFAFKSEVPKPYRDCLRREELEVEICSVVAKKGTTILDAVCLEEVAPSSRWGRGFVVYIKRLSFNNPDPIWHEGLELEDELGKSLGELHLGLLLYHKSFKPHEHADLIVELPSSGHTISSFAFDRSFCFDPIGADIVPYQRA
jgi:hypothetical protein